ncbi:MAG: hypothetical protein H0Z19_05305 [Archaeoglobus sp.]|uniref:hypothetical protein n=1 Tax=Archaeoglobus sp. TaxID=1872626 RepID=UPI001DEFF63E|nr:hypothetical protein [Archaeoglobus sp.]MBO8179885.1 hypothetical protein [Archaeoglobus sp.]
MQQPAKTSFIIILTFSVAFAFGFVLGVMAVVDMAKEQSKTIRELNTEMEWFKEAQFFRKAYWECQDRLWIESECLNGTLKSYIEELKDFNDECLEVNTLLLFYAYNNTVNKTLLYQLDPDDPAEDEKLLEKWGFEVR